MNRRDLLKLGVVATSAPGCATVLSAAAPVVPEAITSLFAKLDAQLLELDSGPVLSSLLDGVPGRERAQAAPSFQEGEALAKKTLKAFLVASTFQSLTPEQWQQPIVTERLVSSMADLDEATLGMTAMLEQLPGHERKSVGKALRDDPALGMRLMGAIDQQAGLYGASLEGRTKLRAASAQAVARMRQSPDLIISEVTGKIRKLEARHGVTEEARRRLGVSMASLALFQDEAQPAAGGLAPPTPPPLPPPLPPPSDEPHTPVRSSAPAPPSSFDDERRERKAIADERRRQDRKKAGTVTMTVGGVALGVALAAGGIALAFGGTAGVISITIGVLLGGVGLIVLLVGLIMFLSAL